MAKFLSLAQHKNERRDIHRAKALRKEAPLAERILWEALRVTAKAYSLSFRRQHPLHPYVADFACLRARLVIEVDGPSHDVRLSQDKRRDEYLSKEGWDIMRFSNQEVRENLENVVLMIVNRAKDRIRFITYPSPNPSRKGRGTGRAYSGTCSDSCDVRNGRNRVEAAT